MSLLFKLRPYEPPKHLHHTVTLFYRNIFSYVYVGRFPNNCVRTSGAGEREHAGMWSSLTTHSLQTNFIVTMLTACTILYTRSAGILYFTAGAVVCSRIVKLLKKVFRQPRPIHPIPGRQKKSHGCVIFYSIKLSC